MRLPAAGYEIRCDVGGQDVRRACEARLRELDVPVPVPFRAQEFCDLLARRRGRPIQIRPIVTVGEGQACGMWIATASVDIILVEQATTPQHQDHIIAHELGHLAFDHYGDLALSHGLLEQLLPHLNPALVRRVLGRSAYTGREEQEAEVFASMLMIGARGPVSPDVTAHGGAAEQVNRFASALEPDGFWRD